MSQNEPASTPMIQIVDACKKFEDDIVLDCLNMSVPTGKIYGLLGPSGCGKTVLLNCILDIRPLDGGNIELGVSSRSQIGYMPQEVGLFQEFTIEEIFYFYGRMFGLNFKAVQTRCETLTEILDLPDQSTRIGSLSGGEQRRISLAVALIHEPKLLILDEPTVGVDPLLSRKIWDFLNESSKNGVTVLVTTHYTEEARMAHVVGALREGRLIIEDSPMAVMSEQNSDSLENAFLQLSLKQQDSPHCRKKVTFEGQPPRQTAVVNFRADKLFNWNRFSAQLVKNCTWMRRNAGIIGLLLLLPAMQSFLFCLSFGHNPSDIKVAVVVDELTPYFTLNNEEYNICSEVNNEPENNEYSIHGYNGCSMMPPFSCHLLNLLRISTDTVVYQDIDEAVRAVVQNDVWAALRIPSNFSQALISLVLDTSHESMKIDEALEQAVIEIRMDSSS